MRSASLSSPQSFNLYSYVGNDPINRVDPSGLFWGKLLKFVSKAMKWIGIAVLVATVVMSGPFAPASGTLLAHILGALVSLGATIGSAMNFVAGGAILVEGAVATTTAMLGGGGLIAASSGVGAVANHLQQRRRKRGKKTEGPKPSIGGVFSPENAARIAELMKRVSELLKKPDCAALLGGQENAAKVLGRAKPLNVNTVDPNYRGPGAGIDPDTNRTSASIARERMLKPDGDYAQGGSNGNVFISDRFLSLDSNTQATVFIHELKHVNRAGAEIDQDYNAEYENIRKKCELP